MRAPAGFDPAAPLRAARLEPHAAAQGLRAAFLGLAGAQIGLAAVTAAILVAVAPGRGAPPAILAWTLIVAAAAQPLVALVVWTLLPSPQDEARRAARDPTVERGADTPPPTPEDVADPGAAPSLKTRAIGRAAYLAALRRVLLLAMLLAAPSWFAALFAVSGGRGLGLTILLFLALAQPPVGAAVAAVAGTRAARVASEVAGAFANESGALTHADGAPAA